MNRRYSTNAKEHPAAVDDFSIPTFSGQTQSRVQKAKENSGAQLIPGQWRCDTDVAFRKGSEDQPVLFRDVCHLNDPFNSARMPQDRIFDAITHYRVTCFCPPAWAEIGLTPAEASDVERTITQYSLGEPSVFYSRLLLGSGGLIRLGLLRPLIAEWLRAKTVEAIRKGIQNSNDAVPTSVIIAVLKLAMYECMYGDVQLANKLHLPAWRKMVSMRGGPETLHLSEAHRKLLGWDIRVMILCGADASFWSKHDPE